MSPSHDKKELIAYLSQFVTENRSEDIDKVLADRTYHITVALEDIYQPHNASAVIRTCDCFGIQDLHIIENRNEYVLNGDVAQGSAKWVDMHQYDQDENNTKACLDTLKRNGYKIVATSPHAEGYTPDTLPLTDKVALVFGTEKKGISQIVKDEADMHLQIPMYGFTESFNISVCAALCLYRLTARIRDEKLDFGLSEDEIDDIKIRWMTSVVKNGEMHIRNFYNRYQERKEE